MEFHLSYNSSALNVWTVTPLVYAGLREAHVISDTTVTINISKMRGVIT